MKTKILIATAAACLLASSAMAQVVFTDNFNRANTTLNTDAADSIGANYQLVQRLSPGDRFATAAILNNQVQMSQTAGSSNIGDIGLLYTGLSLSDTTVSGNSWTVSGQITTHNAGVGTLLYGLIFNRQNDGSFYAARIDSGTDDNVLQFIRNTSAGAVSAIGNPITLTGGLAISSPYELSVTSSAPGVFSYSLSGANITGSLSGTRTDTTLNLNGGYGGFYISGANTNPRFDNLSISVIPEPSSFALLAGALAGLVVLRRRR